MSKWQPIKTAPEEEYKPRLVAAQGRVFYGILVNNRTGLWADAGCGDADYLTFIDNPTHWMPLPDPPVITTDEGAS